MKVKGIKKAFLILNSLIIGIPSFFAGLLFTLSLVRVLPVEFSERIIGGLDYILHGGEPGNDMYSAEFIFIFLIGFFIVLIISNLALLLVWGIYRLIKYWCRQKGAPIIVEPPQ